MMLFVMNRPPVNTELEVVVSDLLQKKKRNAKSTKAQNFLNVGIVLCFIVVGMHTCTHNHYIILRHGVVF